MVGLSSCRPGFRIRHELHVAPDGFTLDDKKVDSATAADSLRPFCAEKQQRHMWRLTADPRLSSKDFVEFFGWIAKVNQDCRGLFALDSTQQPMMLQPPVPAPRSVYSTNAHDSTKVQVSMIIIATRQVVKFWTQEEWLPDIPLVTDTSGMEYVASSRKPDTTGGRKANPAQFGWHDAYGRCLVEARKDRCTDSLWDKTKYVLLGNLARLPDTVDPKSEKDMQWVVRAPLRRDIALAAEIHALRTLPAGNLPDNHPFYHGVLAPDMTWASVQRLVVALRQVGVDFNTLELEKPAVATPSDTTKSKAATVDSTKAKAASTAKR